MKKRGDPLFYHPFCGKNNTTSTRDLTRGWPSLKQAQPFTTKTKESSAVVTSSTMPCALSACPCPLSWPWGARGGAVPRRVEDANPSSPSTPTRMIAFSVKVEGSECLTFYLEQPHAQARPSSTTLRQHPPQTPRQAVGPGAAWRGP